MYTPKSEYYDLPTKYNETVLRLLMQSPTRMYVYWEIAEDTIKNIGKNNFDYNNSTPVLKITNETLNYSYEIEIDPFTTNYYIEVKDVGCKYKVELLRKKNNKYINIYTSNELEIPRSTPINNDLDEIIYKNYIRLNVKDKFTIYYRKNDVNNRQDYYGLNFSAEDSISSGTRY